MTSALSREASAVAKLSEIAEVTSGGGAPQDPSDYGEGIPFVRVSHLSSERHRVVGSDSLTEDAVRRHRLRVFPAGTIILPKSGASIRLEKRAVLPFDSCLVSHLAAVLPKQDLVDRDYLFFWLQRISLASEKADAYPTLRLSEIANLAIPLPSLEEQRRIAHILSTIERSTEANRDVAVRTQVLRRRVLANAFQDDLPTLTIGQFAKVGNGSTPKRDNAQYWMGGSIPWLTSSKIHEGVIEGADQFVTALAAKECHLPEVPAGSVLVAITGQGKTLGNAALLAIDARVSQHLAYIRILVPEVVPEYLYYYLSSRYEHLRSIALGGGSTKGALTCGFLSSYPVPVPSRDEQLRVARHLMAVDRKLSAESRRLRALEIVFSSALPTLLEPTG